MLSSLFHIRMSEFESQHSMAIGAPSEESTVHPDGTRKKAGKRNKKYVSEKTTQRTVLIPKYTLRSKYAEGSKKAGQPIKWSRATRLNRLRRYGVGRASVGTVIMRSRVVQALKDIRDENQEELSPFLTPGAKRGVMMFGSGAIDTVTKSLDLALHDLYAKIREVVTDKYGQVHRVSEYDVRRAWKVISGNGRHLDDIPFMASEGAQPVHMTKEERAQASERRKQAEAAAKRAKPKSNRKGFPGRKRTSDE